LFSAILKRTRVSNHDLLGGLAGLGTIRFDLFHHIQTLDHLAKDDVLVVQPGGLHGANEELGSVRVGASVGHRQDAGAGVLQLEVLVGELVAVDRLAASAVVVGEIAALAHEVGDDAVENGALVAESLLAGAQGAEVLGGLGHNIGAQLEDTIRGESLLVNREIIYDVYIFVMTTFGISYFITIFVCLNP